MNVIDEGCAGLWAGSGLSSRQLPSPALYSIISLSGHAASNLGYIFTEAKKLIKGNAVDSSRGY